ncbi:DUF1491 family protein [Roseibium litorale]|uniref:DUF1491 family protein n=1 Tax=Roseibium litorale TaxID=2803841 RepID=A0ABR9CRR9_9HYPH|nr:DUF1491 family protein [Roseibium litorale]MBD8893527.1 DUF1491 family protein [Roseibium litorale]
MRVTSDFFVSAFVRKAFATGGFASVSRKGAAEAGAVFISVDRMDGTLDLYGPAPQAMFMDQPQGRLFEKVLSSVDQEAVTARLAREARMDPDYWLVEVEARDGAVDLPLAEEDSPAPGGEDPNAFFKF